MVLFVRSVPNASRNAPVVALEREITCVYFAPVMAYAKAFCSALRTTSAPASYGRATVSTLRKVPFGCGTLRPSTKVPPVASTVSTWTSLIAVSNPSAIRCDG